MSEGDRSREVVRAELTVRGRVQGVFYRASAQAEALRLGLAGEVGNLPGGEVGAVAEGERQRVEEFVAWCRRGPPSAQVEDVQVRYGAPQGTFRTFKVAR
ncbi:MAG TPA: acylphosphatase [Myxococcales bacterium]|jgi:acylphosphatase|nr:acylphosphatase [Myxococcales bacterium]